MTKEIQKQHIILHTSFLGSVTSYAYYFKGKIFIEAHENYQKRSTRNKCFIKTSQGKKTISIPLKSGKNQQQAIQDVKISYEANWIKELIHGLETNYSGSPYIMYYLPKIVTLLKKEPEYLWELNMELNDLILHFLDIADTANQTDTWIGQYGHEILDFRSRKPEYKSDYQYPQLFEEKSVGFLKDLSIVDLLFCCGPEARIHLINLAKSI